MLHLVSPPCLLPQLICFRLVCLFFSFFFSFFKRSLDSTFSFFFSSECISVYIDFFFCHQFYFFLFDYSVYAYLSFCLSFYHIPNFLPYNVAKTGTASVLQQMLAVKEVLAHWAKSIESDSVLSNAMQDANFSPQRVAESLEKLLNGVVTFLFPSIPLFVFFTCYSLLCNSLIPPLSFFLLFRFPIPSPCGSRTVGQ